MSEPVFPVLLHHLSADAAQAGPDFPDVALEAVPLGRLRELLTAFEALAPKVPGTAAPEIRFKTNREMLIVRAASEGLRLISWESPLGGSPLTAAQIADSLVRPVAPPRAAAAGAETRDDSPPFFSNWVKAGILLAAILALNAYTVWRIARPEAPEFLPQYEMLPADETGRVLREAAGEYQTGRKAGDRVLFLSANGYLRLGTYGPADEVREETVQFARAARLGDRTYLVTNEQVPFELKPNGTLELFGTVYRRR